MDVNFQQWVDVLGDLENLARTSFGPCGRQVLMTSGSGSCAISKDGKTILDSMPMSHPLLDWFLERVKAHYRTSGDNSKSFVLIFAELLRLVKACHDKQRISSYHKSSRAFRVEMAVSFGLLAKEALQSALTSAVVTSSVAFSTPPMGSPRKFIGTLICSTLQGNLSSGVADYLGKIAAHFVPVPDTPDVLSDELAFITENFSYVCQEISGYSVTDSHISDGVLIPREFAFYDGSLEGCSDGLRVVLIACDFVPEHVPSVTTITLSSSEQVSLAALSDEQKWTRLLTKLQHHCVKALIATHIIPEPLLAMCRRTGISVIHSVCLEDLSLVSQRTGIPMMFDLGEELGPLINSAGFLRRVVLGKDVFSCLGFRDTARQPLEHLVICGPTAATSRVYSAAVHNAFRAALHCFQAPVQCALSESESLQLNTTGKSSSIEHSDGRRSMEDSQTSPEEAEIDEYPKSPSIGHSHEGRNMEDCQSSREQKAEIDEYSNLSSIEHSNEEKSMEEDCQSFREGAGFDEYSKSEKIRKVYAVHGGGAIELAMSNALRRFSSQFTDERMRSAAKMFADALEVIPRALHNNSFQAKGSRYLRGRSSMATDGGYLGINSRSGEWVPAVELGVVDLLEGKLTLWQDVLHTLSDLLRIDAIVGVKRVSCED